MIRRQLQLLVSQQTIRSSFLSLNQSLRYDFASKDMNFDPR